jgi:glycosyltransferase involved in cell wall biosynthesis
MNLKILHILASPHLGGAERVCLDLAKAQQSSGNKTNILFLAHGNASESAAKEGIAAIINDDPDLASAVRSRRWAAAMRVLKNTTSQIQPQIVHSHVPFTHLACHRVLPALGIPWIATMHGSWRQFAFAPQTVGRPFLRPFLLLRHAIGDAVATRSAARVVAVADYVKNDLVHIGISARRITVIHNGLESLTSPMNTETARSRLNLPQNVPLIGAMGYFAPVKGFDILLQAFARMASRHSSVHLAIAGGDVLGDEKPRREIERLIHRLGIGERVHLLGTQDPRAGFMAALDILVISSRTEGLPLTLLEGMWHGKPSVVSSAGGCREAARPEQEGLVFRSQDPADLAEKLNRLLQDQALQESLGKAAWARASTYLTIARCASEYQSIYHNILADE